MTASAVAIDVPPKPENQTSSSDFENLGSMFEKTSGGFIIWFSAMLGMIQTGGILFGANIINVMKTLGLGCILYLQTKIHKTDWSI